MRQTSIGNGLGLFDLRSPAQVPRVLAEARPAPRGGGPATKEDRLGRESPRLQRGGAVVAQARGVKSEKSRASRRERRVVGGQRGLLFPAREKGGAVAREERRLRVLGRGDDRRRAARERGGLKREACHLVSFSGCCPSDLQRCRPRHPPMSNDAARGVTASPNARDRPRRGGVTVQPA